MNRRESGVDIAELMNKLEDAAKENRYLRSIMKKIDDPKVSKALQESSSHRVAPLVMEPDRDYTKEVKDMILNRFKGAKDPEFKLVNNELVIAFDGYGPKYKLLIKGPMRRLKPSKDESVVAPRVNRSKGAHR